MVQTMVITLVLYFVLFGWSCWYGKRRRKQGERLAGLVELHAVIGKDGRVTRLHVIKGYCSLAQSSLEAVNRWQYAPTMLMGQPIEVDTKIDVVFKLNHW